MPRISKRGFIWIPRTFTPSYKIYIDNIDVTNDVISSEWTHAIIGLESPCKLTLMDPNGIYADTYVGGETIELKLDFSNGTTKKWEGKLEQPKKKFGQTYILDVVGSHHQSDLLDVTVTEEYTGIKSADTILKELIDEYLTGFTYNNVNNSTTYPTIKWNNKPFWDCVIDLCALAGFDAYIDTDKNTHFFEKESIENTTEAIVWGDSLLEIGHLGIDTIDIRNKIIVYGEDNTGLPIIYETPDSDAQSSIDTYGKKEKVIKDTSIKTYAQAKELGNIELFNHKNLENKGEMNSLLLPDINPGDMIWVTCPPQKVNGQFRIVKYTHYLPVLQTKVIVYKDKTIPLLFKERKKAELSLQKITNPYKMTNSFNLIFDDMSEIDEVLSSTVTVSEGNLKVSVGSTGTMISLIHVSSIDISSVQVKVVGDTLAGVTYLISTDNGDVYTAVNLETLTSIVAGKLLRLKILLTSSSTRIDSVAVLYK